MDASLLPLAVATATAAGIFGWLTTKPRSPPRMEIDGGGIIDDVYGAASRGLAQAKKAASNVGSRLSSIGANKDAYKERAAEKYRAIDERLRSGVQRTRADLGSAYDRRVRPYMTR